MTSLTGSTPRYRRWTLRPAIDNHPPPTILGPQTPTAVTSAAAVTLGYGALRNEVARGAPRFRPAGLAGRDREPSTRGRCQRRKIFSGRPGPSELAFFSSRPLRERDDIGGLAHQPFRILLHHRAPRRDRGLPTIGGLDRAERMGKRRLGEIAVDAADIASPVSENGCGEPASNPACFGAMAKLT